MKYYGCMNSDIDNIKNEHDVVVIVIYILFFLFFFNKYNHFLWLLLHTVGGTTYNLYICKRIEEEDEGKKERNNPIEIK